MSELAALAAADGGAGATVIPTTVNASTTSTSAASARPVARQAAHRQKQAKTDDDERGFDEKRDRHVLPETQADLRRSRTDEGQLGSMDERIEQPVREHRGSDERGSSQRRVPASQPGECGDGGKDRPPDASDQPV